MPNFGAEGLVDPVGRKGVLSATPELKVESVRGWVFVAYSCGRNPAPVQTVNIPLPTRFHTSQVVQDFSQQYQNWREGGDFKLQPSQASCEFPEVFFQRFLGAFIFDVSIIGGFLLAQRWKDGTRNIF